MTKIEWTRGDDGSAGETWNPVTGCDRISPGCDRCYALTMAGRLKRMGQEKYQNDGDPRTSGPGFALTVHPDTLDTPLRWQRPRRVFVNSMSDLFHNDVPDEFIAEVFAVMGIAEKHTFQVLTKRPQRMTKLLGSDRFHKLWWDARAERACTRQVELLVQRGVVNLRVQWPPPNVWLGTSIEDDPYSFRADHLRATDAAVRFVSAEPLIGALPSLDVTGIDWVIIGGESGAGARPMDLDWVRDLMARCRDAGAAVFVKQLGAAWTGRHRRDLKGHDIATWPRDLQVREWPQPRWWCVAGTITVLVSAVDPDQARARAAEQLRKARRPVQAGNIEVRTATRDDIALFELIKAEEAAGASAAAVDDEPREIVISEDQIGLPL